jgi:hypothetical protein
MYGAQHRFGASRAEEQRLNFISLFSIGKSIGRCNSNSLPDANPVDVVCNFMKVTVSIIVLLTFLSCKGQDPTKELKIPEVGWTLFIPTDSKILNAAQFDTIKRKFVNAMNNTYGTSEQDFQQVRPLFTIRQGQFNLFNSTINPYDSSLFSTWQESYTASKHMLIDLINKQGPGIKIVDTASSTETIDGLMFQKFYLKTSYPSQNLTMNTYWFYRKQGNYDFSINVAYTDENVGKKYLDILRKSKFDK